MKRKTLHSPFNMLMEPELYLALNKMAGLQKTTMSQIARDGIKKELARIDKENNAIMGGQES